MGTTALSGSEQAELIQKAYDSIKAKYGEKYSGKDSINKFSGIMASLCFNYDAKRWRLTGNTLTREAAEKSLKEAGLTEQEILDLIVIINAQHGSSNTTFETQNVNYKDSNYGTITYNDYMENASEYDRDFAHEMIQLAIFSNEDNPSLIRDAVDIFCGSFETGKIYTNYEASFKGDIDSTRYDNGDFASDLDAINMYYMMNNSTEDIYSIFIQYNIDIQSGEKNRAVEFFKSLGDGHIGIGMYEMIDILNAETMGSNYIRQEHTQEELDKAEKDFVLFVMNEYLKGSK